MLRKLLFIIYGVTPECRCSHQVWQVCNTLGHRHREPFIIAFKIIRTCWENRGCTHQWRVWVCTACDVAWSVADHENLELQSAGLFSHVSVGRYTFLAWLIFSQNCMKPSIRKTSGYVNAWRFPALLTGLSYYCPHLWPLHAQWIAAIHVFAYTVYIAQSKNLDSVKRQFILWIRKWW